MKFILSACVGVALLCNADAQLNDFKLKYAAKSIQASSDKSAWTSSRSASASDKKSAWASGKERSDRGGFHDTEVMEACIVEAGGCQLDFEVTALIDSVSALQAEKEAGKFIEAPAEVRTQTKAFMQCIKDVVPALAVDNACRVAAKAQRGKDDFEKLEGDSDEEGDHGGDGMKGGNKALTTISACADEIDFSCALDFQTAVLVASVTALKAEATVAVTSSIIPEVLKLQLKAALKCLKTLAPALPVDSACKAALPTKREHKKNEEADEVGEDKKEDEDDDDDKDNEVDDKDGEDDEEDQDDDEDNNDDKDDEVDDEDVVEEVAFKNNDMSLLSRARIDFANRAARVNVGSAGNRRGY
jgi:hypothetical protein